MKTPYAVKIRICLCVTVALALHWSTWGANLTNRYSFSESGTNVVDSVSGKNGTVVNTTASGGMVTLANTTTSGDPSGQYVSLPPNLVTGYTAITIETWVTPTLDDVTAGALWARVWDFGNSDGNVGIPGFFWFRVGTDAQGLRGDIVPPGSGSTLASTTTFVNNQENHLVWTSDGSTSKAKMYLNGVLVGFNDNFPDNPVSCGPTANDWLGRSQFSGDPYANIAYNEFRIYQGELTPLEVAADFQSGPTNLAPAVGSVTNIQLKIHSPLATNATTRAAVLAGATGLTNTAVNIVDSPDFTVTLTSGNTNILTVDANGTVKGIAPGITTVVATYNSLSSTQSVTVFAAVVTLQHRYSFNGGSLDASDSVGGADGTMAGNATNSNGKVMLDGTAGTYVNLPAYLVASSNFLSASFTIQTWATVYASSGVWAPLWSFGNVSGSAGANYTFLSPHASNPNANRFSVGTAGSEDQADGFTITGVTNAQWTCVYNPSRNFMGIYFNGVLVGSRVPTLSSLDEINNAYSFIGRSLFSADPYLQGEVDEVRIYDGELDKFQVNATYSEGPDNTNLNLGTLVSFNLGTGGTMPRNDKRLVSAILQFTVATNVNVAGDPNLILSSSDTNVVTTDATGLMTSHNVGTATINATYKYIAGGTTNTFTGSASITVFRRPGAILQHRYSFTTDGSDSIGGANGTLAGNAIVSGGKLVLDGTNSYLNLPGGIITSNTSVTLDAWVNFGTSGLWARLYDFGSTAGYGTNTTGPQNFMWTSPNAGGAPNGQLRSDIATGAGFNGVQGVPNLNGQNVHLTEIYDPANGMMGFYTNGVLAALNYTAANVPLSSVSPDDAFFGKSQFNDPYLSAQIDEVRIYEGILYADEIAASDILGPNALLTTTVSLTATVSGSNIVLSWPLAAAGFTLQSRASLTSGSWAPVSTLPKIVANTQWQVSVPLSGNAFFRLIK
jgi:hypothetical protein